MSTPPQDYASSLRTSLISDHPTVDIDNDPIPKDLPDLGKPRTKRYLDISSFLAVLISMLCLALAYITVLPSLSIPWRLGITRQFQVIGVLLSLMNLCFLTIAPKFFLLVEARFGPSYLQNYDAILRNSFMLPSTNYIWRGVLVTVMILPIGLSLAYKEFNQGIGQVVVNNNTGSFYGLTAPAGLQQSSASGVGLSYMANATTSFYSTTYNDPDLPLFPQAYGFNTVLLANESSAKLDAPSAGYVESIQEKLEASEDYVLTAPVLGTVTSYNNSIESHRDDDDFWSYYLTQMGYDGGETQELYIGSLLHTQYLFDSDHFLAILMNGMELRNTSWVFAGFVAGTTKFDNNSDYSQAGEEFKKNAMLFQTRREHCNGVWQITYNSVQLFNGSCNQSPLPDQSQILFTSATLAIPDWYVPSLCEYLGPFAGTRNLSPWLIPTFSTILNGVFWSRVLALNYIDNCGPNKAIPTSPDPNSILESDLCYHRDDYVLSRRPAMNTSRWLFIALAILPALTTIFILASLLMYTTPLDSGFGMIALLAGVQTQTLKLLRGASFSGELKEPLRVKIAVEAVVADKDVIVPRNEYILSDNSPNGVLPYALRLRQREPWTSLLRLINRPQSQHSFPLVQTAQGAKDKVMNNGKTQYRRLSS